MARERNRTPAFERAVAFLEGAIEECRSQGDTRLPTMAVLSRQGKLSTRTLTAAIAYFRERGVLSVTQRQGIRVVSRVPIRGSGVAVSTDRRRSTAQYSSWQRVRETVAQRVSTGVYPSGTKLPTGKELCAEIGCSYATVKRALVALEREGLLAAHQRGYQVRDYRLPRSTALLSFVSAGDVLEKIATRTPHSAEMLRNLEVQCRQRGMRLRVDDALTLCDALQRGRRLPSGLMGFVVWPMGLLADQIEALVQALAGTGLPVSFVDEVGTVPLQHLVRGHQMIRAFSLSNSERVGRVMAHHLLGRGYTCVAYFSAAGDAPWCRRRYQGMVDTYREAGFSEGVTRHAVDEVPGGWRMESFPGDPRSRRALETTWQALLESLRSGKKTALPEPELPIDWNVASSVYQFGKLYPAMEQVRASGTARAWVGSNDFAAEILLRYLQTPGKTPRRQTPVYGFDDSLRSFQLGFSSYNFNVPALVSAMLEHVLYPERHQERDPAAFVEIEGYISERP